MKRPNLLTTFLVLLLTSFIFIANVKAQCNDQQRTVAMNILAGKTVLNGTYTRISDNYYQLLTSSLVPKPVIYLDNGKWYLVGGGYIYSAPAGQGNSCPPKGDGGNDGWAIDTQLPIVLVDFSVAVADKKAWLQWQTETEINADFFSLQRSKNGRDFKELVKIKTGNDSKIYEFTDDKPQSGISYYRLKMVDKDGSFEYSKTLSAQIGVSDKFKVYPTLAQATLTVEAENMDDETAFQILDLTGRVVLSGFLNTDQYMLDISALNRGVFFILIKNNEETFTQKFVKQ